MRNNRSEHERIIGQLHRGYYDTLLVSINELAKFIADDAERIEWGKRDPNYEDFKHMLPKGYTLNDYCDLRKSTGLRRFRFCPECGKAINWRLIKHLG